MEKNLLKKILGLFIIIASMTFVSAATTFSVSPLTLTFTPSDNSESFTITNLGSSPLSVDLSLPTINGITFTASGQTSDIDPSNSSVITIEASDIDFTEMEFNEVLTGDLVITDSSNSSETEIIKIEISKNEFCDYGDPGNDIRVEIKDITNNGIGDDDKWYPLDEIEVKVKVENKGNEDLKDVSLEWGLYDKDSEKWIIEVDEEDEFDLDEDDDETLTFSFTLDNGDLDIDIDELEDSDYVLYVRATGELKDSEEIICDSDSDEVDINVENDYVILSDIKLTGETFCGSVVQLTAKIWNIGDDDQDDVEIKIFSKELEINERVEVGDIDSFDDKKLSFEFQIPKGIDEKIYPLTLEVYDEDGDLYKNSEDDESVFTVLLNVSGNCVVIPQAKIFASLESGGKAGEEMKIKATITNEDSVLKTYTIEASDYSSWAELIDIIPNAVTLGPGQAQDVVLTFNIKEDVADTQTFNLLVKTEKGIKTQPVEVLVETGFSLSRLFKGENTYLWALASLNVLLILIIIIVAIKVARR